MVHDPLICNFGTIETLDGSWIMDHRRLGSGKPACLMARHECHNIKTRPVAGTLSNVCGEHNRSVCETKRAVPKADRTFVHKLGIVLKELNETGIWLELIVSHRFSHLTKWLSLSRKIANYPESLPPQSRQRVDPPIDSLDRKRKRLRVLSPPLQ